MNLIDVDTGRYNRGYNFGWNAPSHEEVQRLIAVQEAARTAQAKLSGTEIGQEILPTEPSTGTNMSSPVRR